MLFALVVLAVGVIGGAMAAVAGAGIGSTLVPLLALRMEFKLAVAAAALPHLAGGLVRAVQLRRSIDRGRAVLARIPQAAFKRVLGALLVVIGGLLFLHR